MATLHLEFPIWVQYRDKEFRVRPLLFTHTYGNGNRYEKALKALSKDIRHYFSNFKSNRENISEVLWYLFNPEVQFDVLDLEFEYGPRYFNGEISTAYFKFQGHTVICLPAFDQYFFISAYPDPSKKQRIDEIISHIQQFARRKRKEEEEEEFNLDNYTSSENEFYATYDLPLFISGEKIELGGGTDDFFKQFFRQNDDFEGRVEVTRVGYSLNELYPSELGHAYYQEELVMQLVRMLYNRENAPIVLLGSKRVGKTALLHEVVHQYLEENQEQTFYRLDDIWEIDPSRVIAGMSIVGMWQRRMEAIIEYVMHPLPDFPRQDKLYLSNVVSLFRIGKSSQNNMTLSDVLKPYLQNRKLQIILEATPAEWDIASELDRSFTDLFKVIRLEVPHKETMLKIIGSIRGQLEQSHGFFMDNLALLKLVELQERFNKTEVLIGSVSESLHQFAAKYNGRHIGGFEVMNEFSTKTHLNPIIANTDISIKPDDFYQNISKKLIGQTEATQCLNDVLNTIKAQLNDPQRPFGSFLFIGPTGVGKTQAAKILANYLFTHEESLVRFDMNEFIDSQAVSRLVGDFYNPEGLLSAKVRYNPYCILLFDEIEKAHPDVHNLLLQVLGEGRLTDALGRTINLCNTVIIMTSNLGAERVGKEINLQRSEELANDTYQKAIRDFFRPEFINRIDKIIIFQKLKAADIAQIAWLQIKDLLKRHGFIRRHTILNVSPAVLENIAVKGFDPEMGGRALKRQIEKELTVLIAEQLAATLPDKPIVFNLYLQNQTIKPHLITLEHVSAQNHPILPDLKGKKTEVDDFEELLDTLHQLKEELIENTEDTSESEQALLDSYLQHLKEQIIEGEEKLRNIIYEYQLNANIDLSGASYQLTVPNNKIIRDAANSKAQKAHLQEMYSQLQIGEYLEEVFQAGKLIGKESEYLYFEMYRAVAWLKFYQSSYQKNGIENILIEIQSKVSNQGEGEIEHLIKIYEEVNQVTEMYSPQKNHSFLHLKGFGLMDLFKEEIGYHMFLKSHEPPSPLEVKIHLYQENISAEEQIEHLFKQSQEAIIIEEGKSAETLETIAYIIRLYDLEQEDTKKNTHTDLRSGLMSKGKLSQADILMWFYMRFSHLM